MNVVRVNRRSLGISFSARGESEILVWAPLAKHVSLFVSQTAEVIELQKQEHGYWSSISWKVKPGDQYFFEIDHRERYPDPASLYQPLGVTGPSEVVNLHHFQWTDKAWENIPLETYIFYELHTGAFTDEGTFQGIETKLDYLVELGITAIEIMPVAQFSGTRNWGYDGVFPFAVQNSYGGPLALQHLINACHEKGLAVVIDVVYNHIGPEGNNFNKFGPYFTNKYKTPWGDAINFDDAGCDNVRKYFIENALMWFRDFHVDALRLDAVHAIKDFSPTHILKELKEYVDLLIKETGRKHYLIAECDLNDVRYIQDMIKEGYGLDAQWLDEFHHALRVTAGHEQTGYYKDFTGIVHLAKSFRDAYVYDGLYSHHRDKIFGTKTNGYNGEKFIVFLQNHDHVGNRMLGERISTLTSFEMQKVTAAAVMMSPYLPLLFMGEEYGEENPFQYFVSHNDKELIESVRQGRSREFAAFYGKEEVPDPQSKHTFENSKLNWKLQRKGINASLLDYYKELILVRKRVAALYTLNRENVTVQVFEQEQVLLLHRWHHEQQVVAVFSFSKEEQKIACPLLRTNSISLMSSLGPDLPFPAIHNGELIAPPESFLLYSNQYV